MMPVPKKQKNIDNFKFAIGMGYNWVDLDKNILYYIEEYKEAIEKGEKPKGIRMGSLTETEIGRDGKTRPKDLGYADPDKVAEQMNDPEPDPRYLPETPREHRRNW